MKRPFSTRTLLGLLLGGLLVVLFYARLAAESEQLAATRRQARQQADQKSRQARLKARRDSASEADWHRSLVAALAAARASSASGNNPVGADQEEGSKSAEESSPDRSTTPPAGAVARSGAAAGAAAGAGKPTLAKPTWLDRLRQHLPWLLPLLAGLGGLLLAGGGWLLWQEQRRPLAEPPRADQPLLRALLEAYALEIGRLMPIPRQVKRFASKARLQNNLVRSSNAGWLAPAPSPASAPPTPAPNGEHLEALAFLLLLLVQENKSLAVLLDKPASLADLSADDFVQQVRQQFTTWQAPASRAAAYAAAQQAAPALPAWAGLSAQLAAPVGESLLRYLHHLNTDLIG